MAEKKNYKMKIFSLEIDALFVDSRSLFTKKYVDHKFSFISNQVTKKKSKVIERWAINVLFHVA